MEKTKIIKYILNFLLFIIAFASIVILHVSTNQIAMLYEDFGGETPVITSTLIAIFNFVNSYWIILYGIVFVCGCILYVLMNLLTFRLSKRGSVIFYLITFLVVPVIIVGLIAVFIYLPLYSLANTIR